MNTRIIKFDINKNLYDTLIAKQGDTKSRFILFNLYDGPIQFDLTGRTVRVYGKKKDNTTIFNDLVITDAKKGYCTLELTNQMLAVEGMNELELVIFEGEKRLSTMPFILNVIGSKYSEDAIVSTNEFTALMNALKTVSNIDNKAEKKDVEELSSQLETIESEKADKELFDSRRVFKPKIYGNLNWSVSKKVNEIYPFTDETLNSWIGCIDGIIIDFQIKPNESIINDDTTYFLNPTTDWLNYVIKKCNDLNIKIKGVKFHADEIRDNVNNLIFTNWFNKYKELIRSVTNVLKCDYLLYFNESSSLLNREIAEVSIINDFTNELKSLGYEVGFAGTGVKNLDKGYVFDLISFHQYPAISGKLNYTTYNDSLIAWEENRNTYLLNKAIKDYPNKKVMLGECGCPDSWECLAVPEKWDWNNNDLTPDMSGKPSAIFLYGMLETYKNTNLDCACFWYNDPMLKEAQILLKKYL